MPASSPISSPRPIPSPGLAATPSAVGQEWVERTLAALTLHEKIGQLLMPWVGGEYVALDSPEFDRIRAWVEEDGVGGLILSMGLPHSYAAKLNAAQERAAVPLLVASDMENGAGMRLARSYALPTLLTQGGATVFPPLMAFGATGDETLAERLGEVMGREARAVGVHMTFGPVLDVNSNPANPIINTRSFGEDPEAVARHGRAYIRGARAAGLMTTGKHFPGHGDTDTDSHIELPTIGVDRAALDAVHLPPFRAAIDEGVDGIMTAHIAVVGVEGPDAPPATLSPYFMTDVLRNELCFDGLLFTDALNMGGVANRYGAAESAVLALEAGADVLLYPIDVRGAAEAVADAVVSGRIKEARIDRSVRRLLSAKARAGLHEERLVALDAVDRAVGVRAHHAFAREVAERSLTLARDADGLVPIPAAARRVLSITYAEADDLLAGRVFDGVLSAAATDGVGRTVASIRADARTMPHEIEALRAQAEDADLVVVSMYVSPRNYQGSVAAEGAFSRFVEALAASGTPTVVVSFGSPYLLSGFPSVSTYLLAWGGEEVSQRAAARALLGAAAIGCRLPISLPPFHEAGEGLARPAVLDLPL
ncbi:MAG: glycoside hydrolase family 3 protein [Rhodothermales bacterium]